MWVLYWGVWSAVSVLLGFDVSPHSFAMLPAFMLFGIEAAVRRAVQQESYVSSPRIRDDSWHNGPKSYYDAQTGIYYDNLRQSTPAEENMP
jgi:hypothetical protein